MGDQLGPEGSAVPARVSPGWAGWGAQDLVGVGEGTVARADGLERALQAG